MALFERGARSTVDDAELVAILDDDASCQALEDYARSSGLGSVHIAKGKIDDTIQYLLHAVKPPKQLLIDLSASDMPLSDLNRLAEVCEPSIQVYAVGSRNDVGLYRDLLGIGVLDYLVKPLTSELVRRLLSGDSAGSGRVTQRLRSGKIMALVGARGGIGVTSIATHLSRTLLLGNARRRIAYVEINPYGGAAAIQLNLPQLNLLGEILGNASRLDPQYLERTLATRDNRLFLLSSHLHPGATYAWPNGALTEVLALLAQHFHYVLVDVPHTLGPLAEEALALSQVTAVVSDLSVHSITNLDRLLPYCVGREPAPTLYLLLNQPQPDSRGKVELKDFKDLVEQPITQAFPHDSRHLQLAENLGEALPEASPFQQSVQRFSSMLSGGTLETQARTQQSWLSRLIGRRQEAG